jgi:hypothetical protein
VSLTLRHAEVLPVTPQMMAGASNGRRKARRRNLRQEPPQPLLTGIGQDRSGEENRSVTTDPTHAAGPSKCVLFDGRAPSAPSRQRDLSRGCAGAAQGAAPVL